MVLAISASVGAGAPVNVMLPANGRPDGSRTSGEVRSAIAMLVRISVRYGAVPTPTAG